MRILAIHNYYRERGGEDEVFDAETELLRSNGHDVVSFTRSSKDVPIWSLGNVAKALVWNRDAARHLSLLIRRTKPDIAHTHNLFPLLSPSVIRAAAEESLPVVSTIHNYRLMCVRGDFYRDDGLCQDCLAGQNAWPAVRHRCYRSSLPASAVVAVAAGIHRRSRVWHECVSAFVAPSEVAREMLIRAGLPATRIDVKPHFVDPDPGPGRGSRGDVVFAGRLSPEKGILLVMEAWAKYPDLPPLTVIGDGPLAATVRAAASRDPRVTLAGAIPRGEVIERLGEAAVLVSGSLCLETFGLVGIEALATGTPIVVPSGTALTELVHPGGSGQVYERGNSTDLARAVRAITRSGPTGVKRAAARAVFERLYSTQANYNRLLQVYENVLCHEPQPHRL